MGDEDDRDWTEEIILKSMEQVIAHSGGGWQGMGNLPRSTRVRADVNLTGGWDVLVPPGHSARVVREKGVFKLEVRSGGSRVWCRSLGGGCCGLAVMNSRGGLQTRGLGASVPRVEVPFFTLESRNVMEVWKVGDIAGRAYGGRPFAQNLEGVWAYLDMKGFLAVGEREEGVMRKLEVTQGCGTVFRIYRDMCMAEHVGKMGDPEIGSRVRSVLGMVGSSM